MSYVKAHTWINESYAHLHIRGFCLLDGFVIFVSGLCFSHQAFRQLLQPVSQDAQILQRHGQMQTVMRENVSAPYDCQNKLSHKHVLLSYLRRINLLDFSLFFFLVQDLPIHFFPLLPKVFNACDRIIASHDHSLICPKKLYIAALLICIYF